MQSGASLLIATPQIRVSLQDQGKDFRPATASQGVAKHALVEKWLMDGEAGVENALHDCALPLHYGADQERKSSLNVFSWNFHHFSYLNYNG